MSELRQGELRCLSLFGTEDGGDGALSGNCGAGWGVLAWRAPLAKGQSFSVVGRIEDGEVDEKR